MKYKEMSKEQQEAFRSLFLNALSIKSQEEQQYTQQFFRLLVLGNGTGIVLLVSFIGANAGKNLPYFSDLVFPLTMFFIGAILAALVYFPLMSVASQATVHIANQVNDFFLNKLNVEDFQGYGFNGIGRAIIFLLLISSLVAFCIGMYQCIKVLSM